MIPQKKQSAAVWTEEAEAAHEGPRPASPRRSHWGAGGRRKRGANRGASLGVSGIVSQAAGATGNEGLSREGRGRGERERGRRGELLVNATSGLPLLAPRCRHTTVKTKDPLRSENSAHTITNHSCLAKASKAHVCVHAPEVTREQLPRRRPSHRARTPNLPGAQRSRSTHYFLPRWRNALRSSPHSRLPPGPDGR